MVPVGYRENGWHASRLWGRVLITCDSDKTCGQALRGGDTDSMALKRADALDIVSGALCLGLLLGTSPITHSAFLAPVEGVWPVSAELTMILAMGVACVVCFFRHRAGAMPGWIEAAASTGVYAISSLVLVVGGAGVPAVGIGLAYMFVGVSAPIPLLCAIRAFSHANLVRNLLLCGLAFLVAGAFGWAFLDFGSPLSSVALVLGLLAGCALLLVHLRRSPNVCAGTASRVSAADLFQTLGIPLWGLFTYAVFLKTGAISMTSRPVIFGLDEELVLACVAAAVLVAMGLSRPTGPLYATMYRVVVPAGIIVILVLLSFPHESTPYATASACIVFVSVLVAQFALGVVLTVVGTGEVAPASAAALFVGIYAFGRICSLALHDLTAAVDDKYAAYQVIMSVLLAMLLMMVLLQYRNAQVQEARFKPCKDRGALAGELMNSVCDELAHEKGLTPRETQVFALLARGFTPAYIADSLVVSDSTVRTHTKSVYRKLGVSSRLELLELVERHA